MEEKHPSSYLIKLVGISEAQLGYLCPAPQNEATIALLKKYIRLFFDLTKNSPGHHKSVSLTLAGPSPNALSGKYLTKKIFRLRR